MGGSMILDQIINQYTDGLIDNTSQRDIKKNNLKKAFEISLKKDITSLINEGDTLIIWAEDYIKSYPRDKKKLATSIMEFFRYLNTEHALNIDTEVAFPDIIFLPKDYRQLEIMKYLHEGPKTREQIACHFSISIETLSGDLIELQKGITFLGYEMKIDLERGTNTYDSTIHPVFLPLNLSEVYALTVGLKKVGKEGPFRDIYGYIADNIYAQLSDYGQDRISRKGKEVGITFQPPLEKKYRSERDLLKNHLSGPRTRMLAYYLKSGAKCKVDYDTADEIISTTGWVGYAHTKVGHDHMKKIEIRDENEEKVTIEINKIVSIELIRS